MIGHLRHVTPTYGWGWVSADSVGRGTPEPFRFGCDGANGTEGIILGDHEFAGATVRLSPRHTTPEGHFNVEIRRDGLVLVQGYAEA